MKYVFKIKAENRGYFYIVAANVAEAVICFDNLMRPQLPQEIERLGTAYMAEPLKDSS